MPATRNATHVAAATNDVEAGTSNDAAPAAAGPLVQRITREATMQMRRRLGLAERARLPDGIKHLVDAAARDIVGSALEVAVAREVTGTAARVARSSRSESKDVSTPSGLPLLNEGLRLRSSDFSGPLLEKARALAAEKNALEATGSQARRRCRSSSQKSPPVGISSPRGRLRRAEIWEELDLWSLGSASDSRSVRFGHLEGCA
jgi:hypothetical protein